MLVCYGLVVPHLPQKGKSCFPMNMNLPINRSFAGQIKLRSRWRSPANVAVPGGRDQSEVSASQKPPRAEALAKGTFSLSRCPQEESCPVVKALTNSNLRNGLFWFTVWEDCASQRTGRRQNYESVGLIMSIDRKQRVVDAGPQPDFLYSAWEGAAQLSGFSLIIKPVWKCFDRYTQRRFHGNSRSHQRLTINHTC